MGFVPRLVLAYGGIFTALGAQLPFLPLWLGAKGLDDRLIGLVLGAASLARLASIPATTAAADRFGDLRLTIAACAALLALSYTALAVSESHTAVFVLVVLAAAASAGLLPLIEGYALTGLGRLRRPYGPVRMWGSGFFVVGNLGAGLLVAVIATKDLIWIIVVLYWVEFAFVFALRPLRMPASERKSSGAFRAMLRLPGVPGILLGASLLQSSHAVYYAFSAIHWSQAGLSGGTIGLLWSIGVVAEIVLFGLSPRLPAILTPAALLLMSAAGGAVRWGAMAFDPPLALLPFLQCLHALSFGATHLASVQFLARVAPAGSSASAQGLLALATGGAMAVMTAASGLLFSSLGMAAYAAMAALAALGFVCGLMLLRHTSAETAYPQRLRGGG